MAPKGRFYEALQPRMHPLQTDTTLRLLDAVLTDVERYLAARSIWEYTPALIADLKLDFLDLKRHLDLPMV